MTDPSPEAIAESMAEDPAFPDADTGQQGLTKREYFAAKAMQSLLMPVAGDDDPQLWSYEEISKCAVKSADALLKELAK